MPASTFLTEPAKEFDIDIRETDILVRYRDGRRPTSAPAVCGTLASHIKQVRPDRTVATVSEEQIRVR